MRQRVSGVIAFTLLAAAQTTARANPWTRTPGSFFVALNYSTIAAKSIYGPDGETTALPGTYSQHQLSLYSEAGVIDRWLTATLDLGLYRRSGLSDQGFAHGLADLRVGLWSGLVTAPIRLSVGTIIGLPTGDPVPEADTTAGQETANVLPTGDGEVDVEFAVAAGHSFGGGGSRWPIEHYALARLGYWLRTTPREVAFGEASDFADAVNWHLELGSRLPYRHIERLMLILRVFGSASLADPSSPSFSGLGGGVSHTSFDLQAYLRLIDKLGVAFSVSGAFAARNLPAGARYTVSLSYER